MQIKTIHVRIDAVDAAASAGKRDAREDAGPEDTVFAAIFANVRQDLHRPKPVKDDVSADPVQAGNDASAPPETGTHATSAKAEADAPPRTQRPTEMSAPVQNESDNADTGEMPATAEPSLRVMDVEGGVATDAEQTSIAATPGNAAKTLVQPAVFNPDATSAQLDKAATTAVQPNPTVQKAETAATVVQQAPAAPTVSIVPTDPAASAEASHPRMAAGLPERGASPGVFLSATATSRPSATAKRTVAAEHSEPIAPQIALESAREDGATARETPAKPGISVDMLKVSEPIVAPRVNAQAKPAQAPVHTATVGTPPATHDAQAPDPVADTAADSLPQPTAEPATAPRDPANGAAVTDAVEAAETPGSAARSAAPTVRYVAESMTSSGGSAPMQTTEVRVETGANGQREIVVIERTPLQALPEQALRGARFLVGNGESVMRVRLIPESLGEVRLEVVTSKNEVTVRLASASAAVREVLQTHAHGLRDAIAVDSGQAVRVTVTPELGAAAWLNGNGNRGAQHGGGHAHDGAAHHSAAHRHNRQDAAPAPRRDMHHNGKLNVYA